MEMIRSMKNPILAKAARRICFLLAAGAALMAAPAGGARPLVLAVLPGPGGGEAEGLVLPFARALDETGLAFTIPSLPEGLEENLAAAMADFQGSTDMSARSYIRSEADEYDLDGILLLRWRTGQTDGAVTVTGALSPFARSWEIGAGAGGDGSLSSAIGSLADSTAIRLGGEPAPPRENFPVVPEGEAVFARALRFGSLTLGAAALEKNGDHDAVRSWLGFRLFLSERRERGREMIGEVRAERLGPFDRRVHEARLAIVRGAWDEAEEIVRGLHSRFPDRFETLLLRGLLASSREGGSGARDLFGKAVRARPLDPLPHRLLGGAALRDGLLDLAREEYGRALDLLPRDTLARIGLASALYSEGLLDETAKLLALPPSPDPHGEEGTRPRFLHLAARAGLALAEGGFAEARVTLREARDEAYRMNDEESLLDLTARLVYVFLEEGSVDSAWTELAELRYRAGKRPDAAPGPPGFPVYLEGLHGAYRLDRGAVAAKRLELETIPGAGGAWTELIDAYYFLLQGEGWEATPPLRRALGRGEDRLVRHLLGRASVQSGRSGAAVQDLEWVVERGESLLDLPPVLPLSFYYLGRALEERGDDERARLAYREFLHYWKYAPPHRPEKTHAQSLVYGKGNPALEPRD
ncbi:MAG: hypothetical protein ABIK65_13195 [Candidatus Eisenbacteria bacterium]